MHRRALLILGLLATSAVFAVPNCPGLQPYGTGRFTGHPAPFPQTAHELQVCASSLLNGNRSAISRILQDGSVLDRYPREYEALWMVARIGELPSSLRSDDFSVTGALNLMLAQNPMNVPQVNAIKALYENRRNFNVPGLSENQLIRLIMAGGDITPHQVRQLGLLVEHGSVTPNLNELVEHTLQSCARSRLSSNNVDLLEFFYGKLHGTKNRLGLYENGVHDSLGGERSEMDEVARLLSNVQIGSGQMGRIRNHIEIWWSDKSLGRSTRRLLGVLQRELENNGPICEPAAPTFRQRVIRALES